MKYREMSGWRPPCSLLFYRAGLVGFIAGGHRVAAHEAARRATLRRWSLARLPCAARVRRGLAKLGCASNNASPDPPAAALLGSAQGWHGAQPHARGDD